MDITRWSIQNQIDYSLCSQRWRSSIQLAKTRLGADCGSDHELLIAKFRLKLKKVGETTRLFRYDINQIPCDYTVGVRNRFKRLDLIDRVPDQLWMEVHNIVQETGIKTIPMENKCKKSKMGVWGGLTNSCVKNRSEKQRRKGKRYPSQCRVPKNGKERYESLLGEKGKVIKGKNRIGNTRDLFKKIRDTKGIFHAKMGLIKDRNGMDLTEAEDIKKRWQEYTK